MRWSLWRRRAQGGRRRAHAPGRPAAAPRRYSTTFAARRQVRRAHTRTGGQPDRVPLDAWGRPQADKQTVTVAAWRFVGTGYRTPGDRALALQAADAARARREHARAARRAARETPAA